MKRLKIRRAWAKSNMWVLVLAAVSFACATTETSMPAVSRAEQLAASPPPIEFATQVQLPEDTCIRFTQTPPAYISELGFVITNVHKPCITYEGTSGFYRDSAWVAMGIPCSAGGGKIEWQGKMLYPKMVSFVLSTDCPMQPAAPEVAEFGVSHLGFDDKKKLLAHNPFILQFWTIPHYPDAGTGFAVDLRSPRAIANLWGKVREGEPVNVHLYGRENAWVAGNNIYFVDANIIGVSNTEFRLELLTVKTLNPKEVAELKRQCDSLRPKQSCHLIF